jgi:type I restriction enzyme R subunit
MRHLIDTYLSAQPSRVLSSFGDLPLVQLLVERDIDAIKEMPAKTKEQQDAVAETIENNVQKEIVEKRQSNPKYYEKMSALLKEIIEQRKNEVINYEEYLKRIVELARDMRQPENTSHYPENIRQSTAMRALYDNLDGDAALAINVHNAVLDARLDGFRGNIVKERKIKRAIEAVLHGDKFKAAELMKIVIEQSEY